MIALIHIQLFALF